MWSFYTVVDAFGKGEDGVFASPVLRVARVCAEEVEPIGTCARIEVAVGTVHLIAKVVANGAIGAKVLRCVQE